jgi:hypothetical protein
MLHVVVIIIIIYIFITHVIAIQEPGRLNPKYSILNYYGSRHLSTNLSETFYNDEPTLVYWSSGVFVHKDNPHILYIADPIRHLIQTYEADHIKIPVGKLNTAGYRDGHIKQALVNKPFAVVIFNDTSFPTNTLYAPVYKSFLFSNTNIPCIYANIHNYTLCVNRTLPFITNTSTVLNRVKVKLINTNGNTSLMMERKQQLMFIADTNNHCIRKVDLLSSQISTYAGVCGESGFKDGPLGINKLSYPQGLGIDDYGNLFVNDNGNNYMRMVTTDGHVHTLINGACFEYKLMPLLQNKFGRQMQTMLCFKKWIKKDGKPSEHKYEKKEEDICYLNAAMCATYKSNLTYQNKNVLN